MLWTLTDLHIHACIYKCIHVYVHLLYIGCKHPAVKCDTCQEGAITGIRWTCVSCYDFDLCTQCYNAGKHSLEHEFLRVVVPQGPR